MGPVPRMSFVPHKFLVPHMSHRFHISPYALMPHTSHTLHMLSIAYLSPTFHTSHTLHVPHSQTSSMPYMFYKPHVLPIHHIPYMSHNSPTPMFLIPPHGPFLYPTYLLYTPFLPHTPTYPIHPIYPPHPTCPIHPTHPHPPHRHGAGAGPRQAPHQAVMDGEPAEVGVPVALRVQPHSQPYTAMRWDGASLAEGRYRGRGSVGRGVSYR